MSMSGRAYAVFLAAFVGLFTLATSLASAHRSGCHRWHSWPSDHGTYVCGDLGYCSQCPDNQYCLAGQSRSQRHESPQRQASPKAPAAEPAAGFVARVLDGDTLQLRTGERVRLIGVDTPEINDTRPEVKALAEAAARYVRMVAEGMAVRLEFDQERRDRYGRLLAYVYLDDGTLLNAAIIQQGYGFAYTRFPFRLMDEFRKLEREAREAKRGLWASAAGPPLTTSAPAPAPRGQQAALRAGVSPVDAWTCPTTAPIKGNFTTSSGERCIYHLPGGRFYGRTKPERCYATEEEATRDGCRASSR